MRPFFPPRQDICPVTIKAFYIVGTSKEIFDKCQELIQANPQLKYRITCVDDGLSATALQLSDKRLAGDFADIKSRAELDHAAGTSAVFEISKPAPQLGR